MVAIGKVIDLARHPFSRFEKTDLVLLPVGSVERHGNHLPLGTDTIIAEEVAKRVAEKLAKKDFVVALLPPVWYGYTWSLRFLDGTASVDPHAFSKVIEEIIVSLASPRMSRFLIINGHGGNEEPLQVAVKEALSRLGPGVKVGAVSWWKVIDDETVKEMFGTPPLHACEVETSIMLAICEECVDLSDVEPVRPPERKLLRATDEVRRAFAKGYLGDPRRASKELGEKLLEIVSDKIAERLARELEETPEGIE